MAPIRSAETSPVLDSRSKRVVETPKLDNDHLRQRFPIEKLVTSPRSAEKPPAISSTSPPKTDGMDWTPSAQQDFRPTVSVYQRNQPSALDGPLPFYGKIPSAPTPPAWKLRTQNVVKPISQVVESNPFKRDSAPSKSWPQRSHDSQQVFKEPTFFPAADHETSTGLEAWFDQAFTIDGNDKPKRDRGRPLPNSKSHPSYPSSHISQYLRLALLLGFITAWYLSENHLMVIRGNYIEAGALGSASLIAGFSLLEAMKRPLHQWNGMEILIYITELAIAVHLGAHLPQDSFGRGFFDR